jgi:RNA 3'-terminal phosphate cyclase (ATP)
MGTHGKGKPVTLDGSHGEGGGQILRTALTLALLTGRAFRVVKIRANRDRPGLRPQHLTAVNAAAELGGAEVSGAAVGARALTFRPAAYEARDLAIAIGTAGATALVLHTLHLPLALLARGPVTAALSGGTFNTKAPSWPFLATTWRAHMAALGAPVRLTMPEAGFYPRGGGRLEAEVAPAALRPLTLVERGPLVRITGAAGVARLDPGIAARMRDRAMQRLADAGIAVEVAIGLVEWNAPSPGAAIHLTAEHGASGASVPPPATFVGLGERGKPAEAVADEAVDELLAFESAAGAVDPHSADQILIPLALAAGPSAYTVSAVTEHLRTNARTIRAFLDRPITIDDPEAGQPGRVVVE